MDFEQEFTPTEVIPDKIYLLDGKGNLVEMEVADDVSDD